MHEPCFYLCGIHGNDKTGKLAKELWRFSLSRKHGVFVLKLEALKRHWRSFCLRSNGFTKIWSSCSLLSAPVSNPGQRRPFRRNQLVLQSVGECVGDCFSFLNRHRKWSRKQTQSGPLWVTFFWLFTGFHSGPKSKRRNSGLNNRKNAQFH